MKTFIAIALVHLFAAIACASETSLVGTYLAESGNHKIELFCRDRYLFGRIIWTEKQDAADIKNHDPKLRSRKVIGIEHIQSFSESTDGSWKGGTIYNPNDGNTYYGQIERIDANTVRITGSVNVPFFGRLLSALFGRMKYIRVESSPTSPNGVGLTGPPASERIP